MSANSAPWLDSVRMDEIRRGQFDREAVFERATLNREARTVELAYSSEQPVERWFGMETLSHDPGAANLQRLNGGANLLVNHDPGDWVGVIERARVDGDRKGRALVRFGNSARAEEVWRDVQDGILRSVSFGYRIDEVKLLRENRNGPDEYLVTRYTPFEISLVTTPADATVGVGRSIDPTAATPAATLKGANMAEQQNGGSPATESAPNLVREHIASEATIRAQAMRDMAKRNADMRALGAKFARWGGNDLAAKAVEDANITFDQFREQVLSLVESRQTQSDALSQVPADPRSIGAPDSGASPYGMGARDMIASANLQVFRGIGKVLNKPDHEIAYRAGMWARGVIFGDPSALRWCRDAGVQLQQGQLAPVTTRTMTEGVFTSAGWLVPVEMETAIISNREQYGVARRICNVIPMGTATMTIPRVTSDITAYFVGEGSTGTASDSGGDQVQLNLKDLMAYTQIGKSTAMDAIIPLAEMVAREQARAFAIKEDACLIAGDGTSTYGGMMGILNLLESAAYAGGRATAATNHDTFAEIDGADVATLIGKLPVFARAGARFVASGVGEALVFGRLKLSAGGQDTQSLQGGVVEQNFAGFPISVAHNMPSVTTTQANKIMLLLGNFQLGVAFGSGAGMMLTVDPYTSAHLNLTRIITTERIDIVAHGVNKSTTVAGPIVGLYGA